MMDLASQIVRDVTLLVMLTLFLELILPRGELNGFVRMLMGLLLVAAVLNPVLSYIGKEPSAPIFTDDGYDKQTAAILEQGASISLSLEDKARAEYERGLAGQIEALAALLEGVEEVEATVSADGATGAINNISLQATVSAGQKSTGVLAEKIRSTVCRFYDLDESLLEVNIVVREGSSRHG